MKELVEVFENRSLASISLSRTTDNPQLAVERVGRVPDCFVKDTFCESEEEWDAFAKPYMEDGLTSYKDDDGVSLGGSMAEALWENFVLAFMGSVIGGFWGNRHVIRKRKITAAMRPSGPRTLSIVLVAGAGGAVLSIIFVITLVLLANADEKTLGSAPISLLFGFGIAYLLTGRSLTKSSSDDADRKTPEAA
jgi:hypothetical protein